MSPRMLKAAERTLSEQYGAPHSNSDPAPIRMEQADGTRIQMQGAVAPDSHSG